MVPLVAEKISFPLAKGGSWLEIDQKTQGVLPQKIEMPNTNNTPTKQTADLKYQTCGKRRGEGY